MSEFANTEKNRQSRNNQRSSSAANELTIYDHIVYYLTLLFVLIMPFLFSRLTTENFLTPKEFFSRIAVVVIGGILCFGIFSKGKIRFLKSSLDLPLFLFFGFCALSVLWNYNAPSAIRDLRGVFSIMLLFPIIMNSFKKRWQVEGLLWAVVFTGVATATIGFLETYNLYFKFDVTGIHYVKDEVLKKVIDPNKFYIPLFPQLASPDYAMGSVVSTFGNRNYLGTFVMFVAFVPLAFFFYYKDRFMKCFSLALFGWLAYGLYITRCRAALFGLGVGLVFMLIVVLINDKGFRLIKRNKLFCGCIGLLILAGLVISAITIHSESMWDKLKLTFTLSRTISNTYERMWVWFGNDVAFSENIGRVLVGQGFGAFKHFFPLKQGGIFGEKNMETFTSVTFRQAHNDWIQLFSELGIVGMALFLFLLKRLYGTIQNALRKDIYGQEHLAMNGDHILIIALGAALVSQLFAGLPDFPFHRIETAVFAVLFISLISVICETGFFTKSDRENYVEFNKPTRTVVLLVVALGVILNTNHELRCWKADTMVRESEMLMTYSQPNQPNHAGNMQRAKALLLEAVSLDPLPGDPYCKLAAWYEMEDRDSKTALQYCEKAWKNINFNARSTYHSVVFRKMHIYYHLMGDLINSYNEAIKGLEMTAGNARSIYYLYAGKIGADILRYQLQIPQPAADRVRVNAERCLRKAMEYEPYRFQAMASLAIFYAQFQNWSLGYEYGKAVSAACGNSDVSILHAVAICSLNIGKTAEALEWLQLALKKSPEQPVFHRDIGKLYKKLGDLANAKVHFDACVSIKNCPEPIKQDALNELNALK